jgi:hypothetical protein
MRFEVDPTTLSGYRLIPESGRGAISKPPTTNAPVIGDIRGGVDVNGRVFVEVWNGGGWTRQQVTDTATNPPQPPQALAGPDTQGFTFTQDATPTTTRVGDTWFNTATGKSYLWFDSRWVMFAPGGGVGGAAVAMPSMEIAGALHDIDNNTTTFTSPVQTALRYDLSDGKFTYDATITENNRCSLGGIVVPPGVYLVTVDWYVNAKTGIVPVAADAVHVGLGTRQYPSGGLKVSKTSYTPRGVISTLQSGEAWTVRTTIAKTKIWLDYLETMTLPSPIAAAGPGALSQGKFTLTVTQLRAA